MIDEPNNQLMIQNAQAVSRVCRYDFPVEWPTLIDELEPLLQQALHDENLVKLNNLLVSLNQIIKSLAMAKIGRTRPALQSKIPILTPIIIKIYSKYYAEWTKSVDLASMEVAYLSLKVLRRIIVDVYETPYHSAEITEFLALTVEHFQSMKQRSIQSDSFDKYFRCYVKIYYNLAKGNPTNLILFPCSKHILYLLLNLIQTEAEGIYRFDGEDEEENVWEFVVIKSLLIFKALINFLFKKGAVLTLKSKSNKAEVENAINLLTNDFFTEEMIKNLTDLLIGYYVKLRPLDIQNWVMDPEEWVNDEVNQNYEYRIRQCAENFFQDLMNNFKDLLGPYILNKIQNEMSTYESASVDNILIKDSIFTIFQLSANSIYEVVDINTLLDQIFFPEALKDDLKERNILKRRVGLLVNEWLGLGVINDENMTKIYSLLLKFLDPSNTFNDVIVRLTSVQVLKTIITDWDFKRELIKPFLKDFTALLISAVTQVELTESKLFLLNTISDLIHRTSSLISLEDLEGLLAIVPKFWDLSNDNNQIILKNSLLRILKNLVVALNNKSPTTWNLAFPLIKACCAPQSEYYTLLAEDGYELWLAILHHYPFEYQDPENLNQLKQLLEFYPNALLNQTEILPLILEIFRSYTLLIPNLVTEDDIQPLISEVFTTLAKYIPSMRDDSLDILISTLELIIISSYNDIPIFEKLLNILMSTGLLPSIISMILDDEQSPITVAKLLLITARLAYLEPKSLISVFTYLFPDSAVSKQHLSKFNTTWYARMDNNIGSPRNRKIHILGLTALLRTGEEVFFNDFSTMMTLWISSLEEINESQGDCEKYHSNYLYEFQYNEDLSIQENGEYSRFQQLVQKLDPVHSLVLKDYLKDTIKLIKESIGDANFGALMGGLDKDLVENFEYFLYQINQ